MNLLVWVGGIAALYASVGHGGASGYLAVLALAGYAPQTMAPAALMLNLFVASTAWMTFRRAGYGSPTLIWPFAAGSIPAALLGAWLPISVLVYSGCLAVVLAATAVRLLMTVTVRDRQVEIVPPRPLTAGVIGFGIGLISGIVGVGGGIFLSPLMIFLRWANPKHTAAASAAFIVVNSVAGLAGRLAKGTWIIESVMPLAIAALLGGAIGAHWGANRLTSPALRRVLAVVLLIAASKLVIVHA